MIRVLDRENTIFNRFIAQMRDVNVQGDSMRFRRNLERAGEVMAYEISKTLHYTKHVVETPLGEAEVSLPDDQLVILILRTAHRRPEQWDSSEAWPWRKGSRALR